MQLLGLGIILLSIALSLQRIISNQKKTDAQGTRIEIELFKIKNDTTAIELNIRAFMHAFNKAVDTDVAFTHLRDATNDEALHSVARIAAVYAQPGMLNAMEEPPKRKSKNGKRTHKGAAK